MERLSLFFPRHVAEQTFVEEYGFAAAFGDQAAGGFFDSLHVVGQIVGVVGKCVLFMAGIVENFCTYSSRPFEHTAAAFGNICQRNEVAAAAAEFAAGTKEEEIQTGI